MSDSTIHRVYTKDFKQLSRGGKISLSIGIVGLIISAILFYWYEYRPSQVVAECNEKAIKEAQEFYRIRLDIQREYYQLEQTEGKGIYNEDDYESYYQRCLREAGIEK